MITRRSMLALAAGLLVAPGRQAFALDRKAPRDIAVEARAFAQFSISEPERTLFGRLTFLGGLELRSSDPEFGGISSGVIDPDGRGFLAVSDHAHWISGRFISENHVLKGIETTKIAPMLAPNGRRMKDTRYYDSEGLARLGRSVFVSVERSHDILQFDFGSKGFAARGRLIEVPAEMKRLDSNRGIEALGILPKQSAYAGALIALAEKAPRGSGGTDNPGFILGPKDSGSKGGRLWVKRIGDFDITDLGFLPGGDLLILERRFVPFFGLGFRIRRIPIAQVRPGVVLDGVVLIEADLDQQIDNMEALMVHPAGDGRVILTLMSDDNFSILQRNLVLRFAMDE